MSRRYRGQSGPKGQQNRGQKRYEDKGIVLDLLTTENARRRDIAKGEVRVQLIGTTWFTLLEVTPKDNENLMVQEEVELGKDEDSKILKIVSRITYDRLSTIAEKALDRAIDAVLVDSEKRFISWINQCDAISIRLHTLQLIKGIGPKFMKIIL